MFESRITAAVETIKDPVVAPVPAVPGVMPCRAMTTWSTVPGVCSSSNLKTVRTELSSIVLDFHSIIYTLKSHILLAYALINISPYQIGLPVVFTPFNSERKLKRAFNLDCFLASRH